MNINMALRGHNEGGVECFSFSM